MNVKTTNNQIVSRLIQGTGQLGGFFEPNYSQDKEVVDALRFGVGIGINAIDTAENYGGGHTEELVAKAIKGIRDNVFISTKVDVGSNGREDLIRSVDGCLKRLGTDYLDLLQTHWPTPNINIHETLTSMNELVKNGKVKNIGLGNPSLEDLRETDYLEFPIFSIQTEYNLIERSIDKDIKPFCEKNNIIILSWSPLLGGKSLLSKNKILDKISTRHAASISQIILSWLMSKNNIYPICRSINLRHIKENFESTLINLSHEEISDIDSFNENSIVYIKPNKISVENATDRKTYKTLEEAIKNENGMVPSPIELSKEFIEGRMPKPIKIIYKNDKCLLIEGRLKYWAWILAFGYDKPIPCNVIN
tara:strand:+ start:2253 stop:3341 length:1089 start_codon:yes stop_codon:yes gene_type:complete